MGSDNTVLSHQFLALDSQLFGLFLVPGWFQERSWNHPGTIFAPLARPFAVISSPFSIPGYVEPFQLFLNRSRRIKHRRLRCRRGDPLDQSGTKAMVLHLVESGDRASLRRG